MISAGEFDIADVKLANTPRELKRSGITMIERIGKGNFGEVWKSLFADTANTEIPEFLVAAKQLLGVAGDVVAKEELMQEATVMAQVGRHVNLVSLIGVVTRGDPWLLLVSYCELGSMLESLKSRYAAGTPYTLSDKCQMCEEIARGMQHLASRRVVHRDLAARNVLLGSGCVAKVADFGLSRYAETGSTGEYYTSHNGLFPVKWTAPDAMANGKIRLPALPISSHKCISFNNISNI